MTGLKVCSLFWFGPVACCDKLVFCGLRGFLLCCRFSPRSSHSPRAAYEEDGVEQVLYRFLLLWIGLVSCNFDSLFIVWIK